MKKIEKRRYQEKTIENFIKWVDVLDEKLATIILPTGTGKTLTAALSLKELKDKKILWVAHREELINQAYEALSQVIDDKKIEVEMAERKASPLADIVVGSVQTISRQRNHFDGFNPEIIVIDEYHHWHEDNKQYAGLSERWPNAKILGLTATPYRFSGGDLPLGNQLINLNIGTAVNHNYLVPPIAETLVSGVSLAEVKTKLGDFDITQLSKAVNVDSRNKLIAEKVIDLVKNKGRQGILFAVDVAHSKAMYDILKDHVRAAEVYGDTPKELRREIIEKVKNKEIDILINNLVFTEGTDLPHLSFVVVARPTRSLGLYCQMIGRGLRTYPNKNDCIIVDVFDKIKAKQSRITFNDMASEGDLYGDKNRSLNILKAQPKLKAIQEGDKVADKLVHFPIFIRKNKDDRWQMDNDTWAVSSWMISEDQWLITWSKEVIVKSPPIKKDVWMPMFGPPHHTEINDDFIVKHKQYGQGIVKNVIKVGKEHLISTLFADGIKEVKVDDLDKKEGQQLVSTEEKKGRVSRIFYIFSSKANKDNRLIHFIKKGADFILKNDIIDTKENINKFIIDKAYHDEAYQLVRADAQWKKAFASDSQKKLILNMIKDGKIGSDLDLNDLTKGEANELIDQVMWRDSINKFFSTLDKKNLVGYAIDSDDV